MQDYGKIRLYVYNSTKKCYRDKNKKDKKIFFINEKTNEDTKKLYDNIKKIL